MTDEIIASTFDSPIPVPDQDQYLNWVDEVIDQGVQERNIHIPLNAVRNIAQVIKLSGIMLAKFFYLLYEKWDKFESGYDTDYIYEYVGYHKATVDRYIRIWRMFNDNEVPEQYVKMIQQRPIKDLVPIAQLVEDGYVLHEKTWEDLADASNNSEVAAIARKVRGNAPRKHTIVLVLESNGELVAFSGEGDRYSIGYLVLDSNEDIVQRSIDRIVTNSGIIKR